MGVALIRAGGVPEHFNLPWRLSIERGHFSDLGLDVTWAEQHSGTGQTIEAFAAGELDIASLLCDGSVAAKAKGAAIDIVGEQVPTSLLWGIHVDAESSYTDIDQINEQSRFAISRYGSGSQLMAYVLAERLRFDVGDDQFVVVGSLEGAKEALAANSADIFLWERFTTSSVVNTGIFRRLDDQPTPWPAFLIATRSGALDPGQLAAMLGVLAATCTELNSRDDIPALVSERYGLDADQAEQWWSQTRWSEDLVIKQSTLDDTETTLRRIGVL